MGCLFQPCEGEAIGIEKRILGPQHQGSAEREGVGWTTLFISWSDRGVPIMMELRQALDANMADTREGLTI